MSSTQQVTEQRQPCPKGGFHEWGTDGQHQNRFCHKCFIPWEEVREYINPYSEQEDQS